MTAFTTPPPCSIFTPRSRRLHVHQPVQRIPGNPQFRSHSRHGQIDRLHQLLAVAPYPSVAVGREATGRHHNNVVLQILGVFQQSKGDDALCVLIVSLDGAGAHQSLRMARRETTLDQANDSILAVRYQVCGQRLPAGEVRQVVLGRHARGLAVLLGHEQANGIGDRGPHDFR